MPPARPSPGSLRERLFLAFGLGSALILVLAAFAGGGDPESAGRAELVSTAARIAEAVKAEWKDWPTGWWWDPATSQGYDNWSRLLELHLEWRDGTLPFVEGHELVPAPGPGNEVFDALLAKSEQLELTENNPHDALPLVLEALAKTKDAARIAEARLRAIQLAVKVDPAHVAVDQFEKARKELDGTERKGSVSYLCLMAIAIGNTWSVDRGVPTLSEILCDLADAHRLAWLLPPPRVEPPDGERPAWTYVDDPGTTALWTLLEPIANSPWMGRPPPHSQGLCPDFERIRTSQALRIEFGEIPTAREPTLLLRRARSGFFACWKSGEYQEGGFASDAAIRDAFLRTAHLSELVPKGFVVDVDPPASKAKAVREHDSLDGDFGFTVKHEDPEGWIRKSAARQKLLRVALLVLALLSAAAGVATFRALRRERTLAELKTDFVANVSHELRTPLASILLLSENLEAGRVTKPEDAARYHALIRREALRLRRLVDDVLDFSRLERGKHLEVHREALHLDPWLEHVFEELGAWAREHALELALSRSPTESDAEIDAEALRRALLNLLDNARKHSGGSQVELRALREDRELVLRVRDHGRGILPADRERVFEPFTRLDGGEAPGAGLGLSIVREIAREHGGAVRALDPESGPGIVFEMRIPLAEETAA